jgi:hypothetical protein
VKAFLDFLRFVNKPAMHDDTLRAGQFREPRAFSPWLLMIGWPQ